MTTTRERALDAVVVVSGLILALSGCTTVGAHAPTTSGNTSTVVMHAAVSTEDLRTRLSIIADDSTEGREAGTAGALRAQRYIERVLRDLGVEPAGERGEYTQALRRLVRRVGRSTLATSGGKTLVPWTDFLPLAWRWTPRPIDGAPVVFGGELGREAIDVGQVAGKVVILLQPAGRFVFPRVAPEDPLHRAAAVAVVDLERFSSARLAPFRAGIDAGLEGDRTRADTAPVSMLITRGTATALLGKRLEDARVGDTGSPVHGSISFVDSTASLCCNVMGVVRGSDPALAGEFVAIGAHLDHLGTAPVAVDHDSARANNLARWALRGRSSAGALPPDAGRQLAALPAPAGRSRPDSIFNGADDDGSGTVALLEIAEALRRDTRAPRRSVLLVWHTGEELGNLGSVWFTEHPTVPLDRIVAQLNLDMIGRGAATDIAGGGPGYLQVVGARRLSRELGDVIEAVNTGPSGGFTLDYQFDSPTDARHYYCRSDHYSYARFGIPIAFFTTGEHADYHQVTDEARYIDYPHLAQVTRFVLSVARELGSRDRRPTLDQLKPDPHAGCRG